MSTIRGAFGSCAAVGALLVGAACTPEAPTTPTTTTSTSTTSTSTTTEPTTTTSTSTTSTTTSTTTTSTTTTSTTTSTTSTTTTTIPVPVDVTTYTPVEASCQGTYLGQSSTSDLETGVTAVAPDFVNAGSNFTISMSMDDIEAPASASGYTIINLNSWIIRFPVPAGASFVSASVSGGSGVGAATASLSGNNVELRFPGPIAGGTTATPATLNVTFQATGAVGSTINTTMYGTSYSNWGVSFNARTQVPFFGAQNIPTKCFSGAPPTFSTTAIH